MEKLYNTDVNEQETVISIDYARKQANCYSSRKTQIRRLLQKLGEPTKTYYTNNKISGATWTIPFEDKKLMNVMFSKSVIVG